MSLAPSMFTTKAAPRAGLHHAALLTLLTPLTITACASLPGAPPGGLSSGDAGAGAGDTCTWAIRAEASSVPQTGAITEEDADALAAVTSVLEYQERYRELHPQLSVGALDGATLRAELRGNTRDLLPCYEGAAESLSDLDSRVVLRFAIDADGHVPVAHLVSSELPDPALSCCVIKRVVQWVLPAPAEGDFVVVEYPFRVRLSR